MDRGVFTYNEIVTQPEAWEQALAEMPAWMPSVEAQFAAGGYRQIIFTGCGSTYYLSMAAAAQAARATGLPARGLPASELWLNPELCYPADGRTLLVAISRSGATSETLRACRAFKADGRGDLLTLSCYPDEPLASLGDLNIVLPSGQEQSTAQTRAFSTLLLAATAVTGVWGAQSELLAELNLLPHAGRVLIDGYHTLAEQMGSDLEIERFYFLGSGARYGLAAEVSLKMKEMTLSHSEPFHFMEFRHGPMAMVNPHTVVVGLLSDSSRAHEQRVLDEMRALGAQILDVGETGDKVSLASHISEAARGVLYLPVLQLMAFYRSLAKGLDPDRPHNLTAVVRLDQSSDS